MEIQLYQINNALLKMEKVGYHFRYIEQLPIQNNKASFLNYKDNNEVVLELRVNEKIYDVSDFLLETREILLKKIFLTYQYLDKKIDDNIKIHVPTNYIYSLLPEKVEKNIEVLKNDLKHLCYTLNYFSDLYVLWLTLY